MASRSRSRTRKAKTTHGVIWYLTWPLHVVPRWLLWWLWELLAGLWLGFCQGVRIGWYEVRSERYLAQYKREGTTLYEQDIWRLLRSITFEPQRNRDGVVICKGCKLPTHSPHCHHIKGVAYHPQLAFTPSNLVGLCADCHDEEHPKIRIVGASRPLVIPALRRVKGRLRRKHRLAA